MRIGFFSETYLPRQDGIAYSMATFKRELEKHGHEVYVFAPTPKVGYKEKAPRVIRFPSLKNFMIDNYRASIFYPPLEVKRIERLDLDLIHFHTPSPIGLLGAYVATKNNLPLVTTYHTDMYQYISHYPALFPGVVGLALVAPIAVGGHARDFEVALSLMKPERRLDEWNKKLVRRMSTVVHNHCDRLIAPSRKIRDQLRSWGTTTPITVLPTGVDPITTDPASTDRLRQQYHLHPQDELILFVGRLGTEKNVELLIKSLSRVRKNIPRAKLIIVGDGKDKANLLDLAKQLDLTDAVIFTGYLERDLLGAAYQIADVFAFPSMTDTQGLVLHEAAQAGVPVVMIDHEVTEVVRGSQNGLFAKNSASDFAAKLTRVLSDPDLRAALSKASRRLATQYSSGNQAAKLLSLYQKVIKEHRGAGQNSSHH